MALHLTYMESRIGDTATTLIKDKKIASRALGGKSEPHVIAVQTETVFVGGVRKEVHRLFVKTSDSADYKNVGWVLFNGVDHCMICNCEFGAFTSMYHCRACGNIVCSKCCPDKGIIFELHHLPAQITCIQCNFGQEEVRGVHLLKEDDLLSHRDRKANVASSKKSDTSHMEAEEARKEEEKRAKEAAYEKEMMNRILGGRASSPPSAGARSSPTTVAAATPTERVVQKTISVTPIAGFVMKSKRSNGEKVFVNVCCHESITSDKDIHVSEAKEAKDKNGGSSPVYDVVIATSLMQEIQKDAELRIQQEVGLRIIDKLAAAGERLDKQFTTPLIKNGYKGDAPTPMSITVESVEKVGATPGAGAAGAAASTGNTITPVPGVVIKTRDTSRSNMKIFINLCTHERIPKKEKPVLFTGSSREYTAPGEDRALIFDAVVHPSTLGNIQSIKDAASREFKLKELCGKVIKVLKMKEDLPKSVEDAFTLPTMDNNYKSDNGEIAAFELPEEEQDDNVNSIHITPKPAFVLKCGKANLYDKEEIFVNVCHHSRLVRQETQKYYMLSAPADYAPHPETNEPVLVFLVVVHEAIIHFMLKDETGEAKSQLCGEVVTLLNDTYQAGLSYDVSIPLVPEGFLSTNGKLPELLNVPPADRDVAVDHSGMLHKQGHGHKSWTHRMFFLQGRSLKYYAGKDLKGTVDIKDSVCEDCEPEECNAPKVSFPFKILTPSQTWYIYADSDKERAVWKKVIEAKVNAIRIATTDARGNRTLFRRGYLKKEGHFFRNWQKRFFVLDMGMLKYYEKESASGRENPPRAPYGEGLKGSMTLAGATVTKENADARSGVSLNRIYISGKDVQDLLIEADTEMALEAWYKDIQLHIEFADNNPHLVDVEDSDKANSAAAEKGRKNSTDSARGSSMFGRN